VVDESEQVPSHFKELQRRPNEDSTRAKNKKEMLGLI